MTIALRTEDVIRRFVHASVDIDRCLPENDTANKEYTNQLNLIVDALEKLSLQFRLFCEKKQHKQSFGKIVENLNVDNISKANERFTIICDQLFKEGIKWSHIVTYLTLCVELARLAREKSNDISFTNSSVGLVIRMATSFAESRLSKWIESDGGGWSGVLTLLDDKDEEVDRDIRKYYGFAALAALFGIYLCSRLY